MPCPYRAPAPATGNDYCEVTEPGRVRTSRKRERGRGRTLALVRTVLTGGEGRGFTGGGGAFVYGLCSEPVQKAGCGSGRVGLTGKAITIRDDVRSLIERENWSPRVRGVPPPALVDLFLAPEVGSNFLSSVCVAGRPGLPWSCFAS